MKKTFILAFIFLGISVLTNAQNTILEARGKAVGTVVTVKGIVTNGSELGVIRYLQDNTAGIAAYGSLVNDVKRGDSVTITGTLKIYNQLLEIDPVSNVVVRSSGNAVPEPKILTPAQLTEAYESQLVKVTSVTFIDAGGTFAGNKKYGFTANGETGYIYIKTSQTDIVGKPIPNGMVSITAILSQFDYVSPTAGYQMLPRTISDLQMASSINLTSVLNNPTFTKSTLDFNWTTNIAGSTQMYYGLSPALVKSNIKNGSGGSTTHEITLTGIPAGQVTWVQAFSVNGTDTASSQVMPFTTISNSSGAMKAYFNTAVDPSYSSGVEAIYLPLILDDTLISYINRAKYTIDLTMYNFNNQGISNISDALKAAATRGVVVRVIGCGTTANLGINELAGSNVNFLIGPSSANRTGIMHNKFILFDTESANPNEPLVWTGSTNLTDGQINVDANNAIIIQDQSLARAYKIEFEEMWGSSSSTPNAANARFGFNKKNNTPHDFIIDGKKIECYFSPTDGVNATIVKTINSTNHDLSIATMLITRNEMADAIAAQKTQGDAVNVITNAEGNNGATVNTILTAALGTHYTFDNVSNGIMHHKFMVVDQAAPASDPLVLTGSHNWSAAADNDNDENTLIIHDATIANIYYQSFVHRFVENNGVLFELTGPPKAINDIAYTLTDQTITVDVLANDTIQAPVTLSIETGAANGNAFIPFTNPNVISYLPNSGFIGKDSITYKISYQASPELFAKAKIYITVSSPDGLSDNTSNQFIVYPNPATDGNVTISYNIASAATGTLQLVDLSGKLLFERNVKLSSDANNLKYSFPTSLRGIYFIRLTSKNTVWNSKVILK